MFKMNLFTITILIKIIFIIADDTSGILNEINDNPKTYSREALQKKYKGFGTEWIYLYNDKNEIQIGYLNQSDNRAIADFFINVEENKTDISIENRISKFWFEHKNVKFILYTRENQLEGIQIKNFENLSNTTYDNTKPTKFITHGWLSSGQADTCQKIKNGFLKKIDANIFVMDWGDITNNIFYPIPQGSTKQVGRIAANFLNELIKNGLNPTKIHLIGHSLGAHVFGYTGKLIKKKIARITGLDPASPGFPSSLITDKSAKFVDVIHTCAGLLGMHEPVGHADFYPNGGDPPQPGCGSIMAMVEACSHGRSWLYFSESLINPTPFLAYNCDIFVNKSCTSDHLIPMGYNTPADARGIFTLTTNAESPFAKKNDKL